MLSDSDSDPFDTEIARLVVDGLEMVLLVPRYIVEPGTPCVPGLKCS
jgi:hypothetical protein